ncbi:MAG: ATP-NAD kinase family protein [Candidatus Aminicenantes bacterium]|nr:ATP-NAD kinase family protein [Candidatus Aminicenantes bacterium]
MDTFDQKRKLGLIVNPIAGMGGRVGLKGTDGLEVLMEAKRRGAVPRSGMRAFEALKKLKTLRNRIDILTCPREMGEEAARKAGFEPILVGRDTGSQTSAADTRLAAREMKERGVDLLLFAGGDGTARDIFQEVGESLVVLGIPAGVKIHSAVFSSHPESAGELAAAFLNNRAKDIITAEVMDIDENLYRQGVLSAQLYGYLHIPFQKRFIQGKKSASPAGERYQQQASAAEVVEHMDNEHVYIIGPGTTTREILRRLGTEGSLLGVDLLYRKCLEAKDLNEAELLSMIKYRSVRLILTPIGGQGCLLGRGNQPISPDVMRMVGKKNMIIVATPHKIHGLFGRPMWVDTGDTELDNLLSGWYRVVTGYREHIIYKVGC